MRNSNAKHNVNKKLHEPESMTVLPGNRRVTSVMIIERTPSQ